MTLPETSSRPTTPRSIPWLPAALLIFFQVIGGLRDMPLGSFFPIFLQEKFGLSPVAISAVVSGAQAAGMVAALLGGAITTRWGSKRVLLISLVFAILGSLAFQVEPLWLIAVLWLCGGAGLALAYVGGASYLTRIGGRSGLGILSAFFALSMTAGGALGNPIAGLLIERYGFRPFAWVATILSLTVIAVLVLLMENPLEADAGTGAEPPSLRATWAGMLAVAHQANVRRVIFLRALPTLFYGMLVVLIPLMLNDLTGSKVLVAAYGTTNLIVASLAQLLAGRAADRRGARRPTLLAFSALVFAGLGLALTASTAWGLFVFGVLGIAAAWSLSTMLVLWVNDGIRGEDHPATFGLLHAVWSLSMIGGAVLGGWFVTNLPGLPFLLGGLVNVGAILLVIEYYRQE